MNIKSVSFLYQQNLIVITVQLVIVNKGWPATYGWSAAYTTPVVRIKQLINIIFRHVSEAFATNLVSQVDDLFHSPSPWVYLAPGGFK